MSAIQYFPPELIEYIISFLPNGASSLIRPLSLVSRSWTIAAQNKLYGTVVISQKNQWRKLITRLKAFPHLRPVVKTIEVRWTIPYSSKLQKLKLRELFPNLEGIRYHEEVEDCSLLLPLATAGIAQHSLRNLDLSVRHETLSFSRSFVALRTIGTSDPSDLGIRLDVKSLTVIEESHSSSSLLHINILKSTAFNTLHKLVIRFAVDRYVDDGDYARQMHDNVDTDALAMDTLSRVEAVVIELSAHHRSHPIIARCKAHLAVAYSRKVVSFRYLEGQSQGYEGNYVHYAGLSSVYCGA